MIESVSAEKSRSAFRNVLFLFGRALISERAVYGKQNAREKNLRKKECGLFLSIAEAGTAAPGTQRGRTQQKQAAIDAGQTKREGKQEVSNKDRKQGNHYAWCSFVCFSRPKDAGANRARKVKSRSGYAFGLCGGLFFFSFILCLAIVEITTGVLALVW